MDEDLLTEVKSTGRPGLNVYRYPRIEAVIGRGGRIADELHSERLLQDGVPMTRRRGGGCAVVLDPGNLIVSIALPLPGVGGIRKAFDGISTWMIELLSAVGVPNVVQRGVSDLVLGERKIGGSCIWRTRGLLYYSSTLLVVPQAGLMDRYLKHPPREPQYRRNRPHAEFTTSLAVEGLVEDPNVLMEQMRMEAERRLPGLYAELSAHLMNLKLQDVLHGEVVNL